MIMEKLPKGGTKTQQFNISNIGQSDLAVTNIELIGGDSAFSTLILEPARISHLPLCPGEVASLPFDLPQDLKGLKRQLSGSHQMIHMPVLLVTGLWKFPCWNRYSCRVELHIDSHHGWQWRWYCAKQAQRDQVRKELGGLY